MPMKERGIKDYAMVLLKGIGMGASDVVPGVSGGTIAFITGIYDELITSIKSINAHALKLLFTGKIAAFWKSINANFLCSLFLGIAISIFSLAKLITYLLTHEPTLVWSFFFGLVLASTWFVAKGIQAWNWKTVLGFLVGGVVAYYITVASPAETSTRLAFIFLCGAIAICAMILPGISGSFILVLLGKYFYLMEAVYTLNVVVVGVFLLGAVVGIACFSRFLSWSLRRFRSLTLAVLSGFMLGSLNKVWPWKEQVEAFTDGNILSTGKNVLPDSHLLVPIVLMVVGFLLVYILQRISEKKGE
ncbi:MAG: DUF368 domain-containing protein [Porphyromonadaceae bacterium]|nr:DUF368 domain-containing protein [Porphyromonadaceae bacterium]